MKMNRNNRGSNGHGKKYIIFDDEGHGFEKIQNKKDSFTTIVSFLKKHL
tara:strand:- start:32 stop:178 length:147 start_codon:yes stop_codon:yes gene_type:complete